MATIKDAAINRWYDEEVRTLAQDLEIIQLRLISMNERYNLEISTKLSKVPGTDVLDLRVSEGIPIPTKDQILTWVSNAQAILTALETAGRKGVLTFPAVRPPV